MKSNTYIAFFLFLFISFSVIGQKDSVRVSQNSQLQLKPIDYKPLSPARAAFYSAILPGAGQIYNNRYWWQLPAIYGGLGASIYFYVNNNKNYNRYRTAYKLRKAGLRDEFTDENGNFLISETSLESAQRQTLKNRDLSMLSIILVYVLQIVEASVTAHLLQFDTNDNLSLQPSTIPDPTFQELPKVGFSLKYTF